MIFACGTALFSDGYQNGTSAHLELRNPELRLGALGVIGTVNTLIKIIYKDTPGLNLKHYSTTFSSVAFAGTVCGMLVFGLA